MPITPPPELIALEDAIAVNPINTRWFLPFVIHRLQPRASQRRVTLDLTLNNIVDHGIVKRQLQLVWAQSSETMRVPPVQEHIITEWAACGVACVLLPLLTPLQVLHVSQAGDRFDYWVGNDQQEFGLEISGTLNTDLMTRHRSKVRQLLSNKQNLAGFVSVTNFQTGHSILSFHKQEKS